MKLLSGMKLLRGLINFKLIDKKYQSDLPSDPEHFKVAMKEDAKFWIDNFDRISERWNKWAGTN